MLFAFACCQEPEAPMRIDRLCDDFACFKLTTLQVMLANPTDTVFIRKC